MILPCNFDQRSESFPPPSLFRPSSSSLPIFHPHFACQPSIMYIFGCHLFPANIARSSFVVRKGRQHIMMHKDTQERSYNPTLATQHHKYKISAYKHPHMYKVFQKYNSIKVVDLTFEPIWLNLKLIYIRACYVK